MKNISHFLSVYGSVSPIIKSVFNIMGASVSTLQEANDFAQTHLLLSHDQWFNYPQTDLRKKLHTHKITLLNDLKLIGMIDTIEPAKKEYVYAIVMGSFKDDVLQRLDFLARLYEKGYVFENIVLLGGERLLQDFEKNELPENINTEILMMDYLCKQYKIFNNKKILLINEPAVQKGDGTLRRPTTDSTLRYFAKIITKPGACLVVSNNPYIQRQTKVAQRIFDQTNFPTDGAGPAFKNDIDMDIVMVMDEFARRLYEELFEIKSI